MFGQVDFDSCSLPVLAANNICNELCGRCQTSTPAKDSNESTDQDSDKVKKDEDSSSGGDSEKTGDGDEKVCLFAQLEEYSILSITPVSLCSNLVCDFLDGSCSSLKAR